MISVLLTSFHMGTKQLKRIDYRSKVYYQYYQDHVKLVNPKKGNATFFSLVIMTTILTLLLCLIQKQLNHQNDHLSAQKALVCLKRFNLKQMNYITKMNKANSYIRAITIGSIGTKIFSIVLPGLAIVNLSAKKALRALKVYQQSITLLYLKKRLSFRKKSCQVLIANLPLYYRLNGLKLKRNKLGITILRKKKWKQSVIARKVTIITKVHLKNAYLRPTYSSLIHLIGKKGLAF